MPKSYLPKLVSAVIAIILIIALLAVPFQNQSADAARMKRYHFFVTLKTVPPSAEDLIMNATVTNGLVPISWQIKTVNSPTEDQVVRFVVKLPVGSGEDSFFVCGMRATSGINSCEHLLLPTSSGPIKLDFTYP